MKQSLAWNVVSSVCQEILNYTCDCTYGLPLFHAKCCLSHLPAFVLLLVRNIRRSPSRFTLFTATIKQLKIRTPRYSWRQNVLRGRGESLKRVLWLACLLVKTRALIGWCRLITGLVCGNGRSLGCLLWFLGMVQVSPSMDTESVPRSNKTDSQSMNQPQATVLTGLGCA